MKLSSLFKRKTMKEKVVPADASEVIETKSGPCQCTFEVECESCADVLEVGLITLYNEPDASGILFPSDKSVPYGKPVIFNYKHINTNPSNIEYYKEELKENKGRFIITKPGKYLVNWWVSTQTVLAHSAIGFAIASKYSFEDGSHFIASAGMSPMKSSQISGTTVLIVEEAKLNEVENSYYEFYLLNLTGGWQIKGKNTPEKSNYTVYYAQHSEILAGLSVVEL